MIHIINDKDAYNMKHVMEIIKFDNRASLCVAYVTVFVSQVLQNKSVLI